MPRLTLPDGSVREYAGTTTGQAVAESIGAGLAKAAVAIVVDGQQQDLSEPISADASIRILTVKDPAGLEVVRHTLAAQVLARAVKELYPAARLAIGPTIEDGCYYDIAFPNPISSDDLPKIESRMKEIIAEGNDVVREEIHIANLTDYFRRISNEPFKIEIMDDQVQKGRLIKKPEIAFEGFSAYRQKNTK
ncbi:MAG: TGS domain-containing protein, partial [Alphaproteobacteria bacterium]|nr:TGS domain-containing protein [Alphaproteobacteria bacterium]